MNISMIKHNLVANLSTGFHWNEWSLEEQNLYTLMFYEMDQSSEESYLQERRNLMRRLFNRLDITNPPLFIEKHYKNIRNSYKYAGEITSARELILAKKIMRRGNLPPIY